jgi:hypothetical protein
MVMSPIMESNPSPLSPRLRLLLVAPASDENDCIGKCVAALTKFAIDTLPNPPKLRFATYYYECRHFEEYVEFVSFLSLFSHFCS